MKARPRTDDLPRAFSADHPGRMLAPNTPTFGAPNTFAINTDVVIHEIMYHFREDPGTQGAVLGRIQIQTWAEDPGTSESADGSRTKHRLPAASQGSQVCWTDAIARSPARDDVLGDQLPTRLLADPHDRLGQAE